MSIQQKVRNLLERLFGRKQKSMVVDSGATSHFVRTSDNLPKIGPSDKIVSLPNGAMIKATHMVQLLFEGLTNKAQESHVLPELKAHSLISVPKLANEGYVTLFLDGQKGVVVYKANDILFTAKSKPVLKGCRDLSGLWKIESRSESKSKQETQQVHNVYDLPSTKTAIKFLHGAAGFPVKATWIAAIKNGNFATWPNLTAELVDKYFPESTATQKGHMKKQRQNVRSTKVKATMQSVPEQKPQQKHHEVYIKIYNAHETIYSDQTGQMPIVSNRGNRLVMVVFKVDSNYIDAKPMKDSTDGSLIQAYHTMWTRLTASGVVKPKLHILDNEVSANFKAEIKKNSAMQLVPPDTHRRNLAERAIQTFKSHFVAILSGVDESFPMPLWDRLLPQAVMTLNMLRQSREDPKVSAYEYVNGKFDYNKMPLAPMGCAVQVHVSPNRRLTWAAHSLDGWYLRTSDEHYRCHVVFVKQTRSERISDTVFFQHKYITNPTVTHEDKVVKALGDTTHTLLKQSNIRGREQMRALKHLQAICNTPDNKKRVTFQDNTSPEPRVADAEPRVASAENVSPTIPSQTRLPRVATEVIDKPINTGPASNTRRQRRELLRRAITAKMTKRTNQVLQQKATESANLAILDESGKQMTYRRLMKNPETRKIWSQSAANEFGRLAQGIGGRIQGTNTIYFITKREIPSDRIKDVTYVKFVCEEKPNKAERYRTRLAVGGDRVNYPDDVGTPTADLLLVKTHLNSTISTPNAKYLTLDIHNFYLNTPMVRFEYARVHSDDIPEEVANEYNLKEKVDENGYVYIEIQKGMYGLPQAGILAQELLEKRLKDFGYTQSKIIHGLWKHATKPTTFTLVVDDFGVKYTSIDDANHLIKALETFYEITIDWTGSKYIGLTLDWDYKNNKVHLSMPGYIRKAIEKFQHPAPNKPQNSPHQHAIPMYRAKVQYTESKDETPLWIKPDRNLYKRSLERCCIMQEQ